MRVPHSVEVKETESEFRSLHQENRIKKFTGALSLRSGGAEGVAVYIQGWPVYAYYTDTEESYGEDALNDLMDESGHINIHISSEEKVEMFRTYSDYLGYEGFIRLHEADEKSIAERTVMRDDEEENFVLPPGTRMGYAPTRDDAYSYFQEEGISGYVISNHKLVTFREGTQLDEVDLYPDEDGSLTLGLSKREEVEAQASDYVNVYSIRRQYQRGGSSLSIITSKVNIEGWEIIKTDVPPDISRGEDEAEEEDSGGFISNLLGG